MADCCIAMPSINIMSTPKLNPTRSRSRTFSVCLNMTAYLARQGDNYRFVSGLLEAWWRARHDRHFVSIACRQAKTRG